MQLHHRDPNHCILLSPNSSFKATFVSARLVTKANLERTVPDLKEVLVSSEEGVARVRGAAGDTKGEVCYHVPHMVCCSRALLNIYWHEQVHSWCVGEEDEEAGEDSQPFVSWILMLVFYVSPFGCYIVLDV